MTFWHWLLAYGIAFVLVLAILAGVFFEVVDLLEWLSRYRRIVKRK